MQMARDKAVTSVENAVLHSTGPTSAEGKAASSQNAMKHGLLSTKVVLPDEDPAAFAAWREGLLEELGPASAEEEFWAEQFIGLAWKLKRADRMEAELFESSYAMPAKGEANDPATGAGEAAGAAKSATPLADALRAHGKEFALMLRYRAQRVREMEKARQALRVLQEAREKQRREKEQELKAAEKAYEENLGAFAMQKSKEAGAAAREAGLPMEAVLAAAQVVMKKTRGQDFEGANAILEAIRKGTWRAPGVEDETPKMVSA